MVITSELGDQQIASALEELRSRWSQTPSGRIIRVEKRLPVDTDPLLWLAAQKREAISRAGYWRERDTEQELAAVGISDLVHAPTYDQMEHAVDEVSRRIGDSDEGSRYFGGLRFEAERGGDDVWDGWGGCEFALPACGVERTRRGVVLFLQARSGDHKSLQAALTFGSALVLECCLSPNCVPAQEIAREDCPTREAWESLVGNALDEIRVGKMKKVVLARRTKFIWSHPRNPFAVLVSLRAMEPHCTIYSAFGSEAVFLGASPELLFFRHNRELESESLAGTVALDEHQGSSDEACLSLHSAKNHHEQSVVTSWICRRLSEFSQNVDVGETRARQFNCVSHLLTTIRARLHNDVTDAQLLRLLHPTPAIAGQPRDTALSFIGKNEPFERGWYAAPVGWIGKDAARFIVALRCGMLRGVNSWIYTGAGIVDGSTPSAEWDEVENKTRTLRKALAMGC